MQSSLGLSVIAVEPLHPQKLRIFSVEMLSTWVALAKRHIVLSFTANVTRFRLTVILQYVGAKTAIISQSTRLLVLKPVESY